MQKETVRSGDEPSRALTLGPEHELDNELALRLDALVQAVRARDHAMAVVAHDLRSPMEIISLSTAQLLQTLREPLVRRHLERIDQVTRRAASLIEDLLDVVAIEAGKLSISKAQTDLSKTIASVVEAERVVADRRTIVISMDVQAELPLLEVDQHRIQEVLQNLIDNALKFTAPGGYVSVGAAARESEILGWVKDTGIGIPEADLPHLFEPFWRAKGETRRGSGLGLTISKAIVEGHGGRIWVESAVGRGTVVFFALPARG